MHRDENSVEAQRKRKAREAFRGFLQQLLDDPVYRIAYDKAFKALITAEQVVERLQRNLAQSISAARVVLENIHENAARLPNGSRVYRDSNGVVRREDGSVVDDTLVATIVWTGSEPSFEEMQSAVAYLDGLLQQQQQLNAYQNETLGPARDRLTDEDHPPSLEELDEVLEGIETLAPESVAQDRERHNQAELQPGDPSKISVPKLN
ncbi:MAG: hypothetical protein AAF479_05895 [Pseudomonadota bacterium]